MDKLLFPTEAAEILGVHVGTLRRLVQRGRIKSVRISKRPDGPMKIRASELEAFIEDCTFQASQPDLPGKGINDELDRRRKQRAS